MLDFLLYNDILGLIICLLSIIGIILFSIIDTKPEKKQTKTTNKEEDGIRKIQNFISYLELALIFMICIYIFIKKSITVFLLISLFALIYALYKLFTKMTFEKIDNYLYLCASYFYFLFFKSNIIKITYSYVMILDIKWQQPIILLLLFIKIHLFIFFLLINFRIIISYLYTILPIEKIKKLLNEKEHIVELRKYNFNIFKKIKKNFLLIIDVIIYAFTFPFFLLSFIFKLIFAYMIKIIKIWMRKFLYSIYSIYKDSNNIIKKFTKISAVFTIIFIYILVIYDNNFISQTKEVYDIIAITIICPIVIDSINTKTRVF